MACSVSEAVRNRSEGTLNGGPPQPSPGLFSLDRESENRHLSTFGDFQIHHHQLAPSLGTCVAYE
jgi:hypothetical protein